MMQVLQSLFFILVLLPMLRSRAFDGQLNGANNVAYTILVDKSGRGNFTSIQSAINLIPDNNLQWIRIQISAGRYIEKVTIPASKPYIFMEGAGSKVTRIQWSDHGAIDTCATFTSFADNFVAKGIAFDNNSPPNSLQALAARIAGDKSAFLQCEFHGIQDTIWDQHGRHYFKGCYITGAVDFIFGNGQSIYEKCRIFVNIATNYPPGYIGYITAQNRQSETETTGFVFKDCEVTGNGTVYLGRAWGPCSAVIFYHSYLSDVVMPAGWDAWQHGAYISCFTYAEAGNRGPGANTSKRVPWQKKLGYADMIKFVDNSFINSGGWLYSIPVPIKIESGTL